MKAKINIRDGEARPYEKIFEDESLDVVVRKAHEEGMKFTNPRIDRVEKDKKDNAWNTQASTEILPVIYLEKENKGAYDFYMIAKRTEDKKYILWEYKYTP